MDCRPGDGCGAFGPPAAVNSSALYFIHRAASPTAGGSITALGVDGRVVDGWPVGLKRAGSMFWSIVAASEGGVWALAIEPEKHDLSATILRIASGSTVVGTTSVVEP